MKERVEHGKNRTGTSGPAWYGCLPNREHGAAASRAKAAHAHQARAKRSCSASTPTSGVELLVQRPQLVAAGVTERVVLSGERQAIGGPSVAVVEQRATTSTRASMWWAV